MIAIHVIISFNAINHAVLNNTLETLLLDFPDTFQTYKERKEL